MPQFEEPSASGHGDSHDDGLTDAVDLVDAPMQGCVKEMVGRLLEGRQIENAVLHLGYPKPCDAQNLTLQADTN